MRRFNVLLVNAPWDKPGFYGVRAGSRWPHFERDTAEYVPFPFFLAYAAALLIREKFNVFMIDCVAQKLGEKQLLEEAQRFSPDLILMEISTVSLDWDLAVSRKLKEAAGGMLALAGLHAPLGDPAFLAGHDFVDFALYGEYEATLLDLAVRLRKDDALDACLGLVHRIENSSRKEAPRPLVDVDSLPWPARHFLPMLNYRDEPGNIPRPSVQMWSSRGCPFGCTFCAWPQIMYGGSLYRPRSVDNVVDEMEWLATRAGFASVYFDDDTFNVNRDRTLQFASKVEKRRIGAPFAIMARADLMDREQLVALKKAGMTALKYGVESADSTLLRNAGKALDPSKVEEIVSITHELGIKSHLTFMFGLPGETEESAQQTIDLALRLNPESVQFTIATPFPGSRFYRELEQQGRLIHSDWSRYDGFFHAAINGEHLSAQRLEQIVAQANQTWWRHVRKRAGYKPDGFQNTVKKVTSKIGKMAKDALFGEEKS